MGTPGADVAAGAAHRVARKDFKRVSVPIHRRGGFSVSSTRRASIAAALLIAAAALGCTPSDRPATVPASAHSIVRQKGNHLITFTAPERGVAFVYDRSTQNKIYAGWIKGGETLEVDPAHGEVRIDGHAVVQKELHDSSEYELWFDPRP